MSLRGLDDRVVPRLAAALQRLVDRLPGRPAGPDEPPALVAPPTPPTPPTPPPPPTRPGPAPAVRRLRDVDDRYAGSGALRLFREVPQLGALALAVLVLVAGATVWTRNRRADDGATGGPTPTMSDGPDTVIEPPDDNRVGPALGEDVPAYLEAAAEELHRRNETDPETLAWSVISFDRYFTPREAALLITEPQPQFVLFRVPPGRAAQSAPAQARVRDLERDALAAFKAAAREKRVQAAEFDELARTSANDPAFQEEYESQAARARYEAAQLVAGCRCVFGVVVKAPASLLVKVATYKGVRVVDVGPADAPLAQLQFRGLLPEEKQTVTGGNEGSPGGNG